MKTRTTAIGWTDHTLNFWWGCTKVSEACAHCYAETVARVFGKKLFGTVPQWGKGKPRFQNLESARNKALKLNKAAEKEMRKYLAECKELAGRGSFHPDPLPDRPRVFVNSMSDWLDEEVPAEWLTYLLETVFLCPWLDFQLLTKRPENWHARLKQCKFTEFHTVNPNGLKRGASHFHRWLHDWLEGDAPLNAWIGTTVESQEWADRRIFHLTNIPAKVRFLSCEPLLGPLELAPEWLGSPAWREAAGSLNDYWIHWVIAGGESGGQARPSHPDWFRSLRDQCDAAEVPFFFKQWGEWMPGTLGACTEANPQFCVKPDGELSWWAGDEDTCTNFSTNYELGDCGILRLGTAKTGNLLDGVLHAEFPTSPALRH